MKLGADDYVKKSGGFSIKVLIERIRVQLRKLEPKTVSQPKNILTVGRLTLDSEQLECEWGGKALPDKLTTTEFKIIYELAEIKREHIQILIKSLPPQTGATTLAVLKTIFREDASRISGCCGWITSR